MSLRSGWWACNWSYWFHKGLSIFSKWRSQMYKNSASIKLQPHPYFGEKNSSTPSPPHPYTPYTLNSLNCIDSVFLNKINTLPVVILWLPAFWSSKIVWPPPYFSFQNLWPSSIFGTPPHSEENDSPPKQSCIVFSLARWSKRSTLSELEILNFVVKLKVGIPPANDLYNWLILIMVIDYESVRKQNIWWLLNKVSHDGVNRLSQC